jgi:hypothetical protein
MKQFLIEGFLQKRENRTWGNSAFTLTSHCASEPI